MNCKNCGAPMADDATLCPSCGAPVYAQPAPAATEVPPVQAQQPYQQPMYQQPAYQQPAYQQPMYQQPYQQPVYQQPAYQQPAYQQPAYAQPAPVAAAPEGAAAAPEKPNIKKFIPFIAIGVAAVAVIAIVIAVVVSMLGGRNLNAPIFADIDDTGAYITLEDEVITLKAGSGKIAAAYLTVDREKIVVFEETAEDIYKIYWTDIDQEDKFVIAEGSSTLAVEPLDEDYCNSSEYFYYYTESASEMCLMRYSFEENYNVLVYRMTESSTPDGVAISETFGEDTSFAVAENGNINILTPGTNEFVTVGTYNTDGDIKMLGVSATGDAVVWTIYVGGTYYTYIYNNENEPALINSQYNDPDYEFMSSADGKICYLASDSSQLVSYVILKDVYFGVEIPGSVSELYSMDGYVLNKDTDTSKDGMFVRAYVNGETKLYYVDFSERTFVCVLNNVKSLYRVTADNIIYKDADGNYLTFSYNTDDLMANDDKYSLGFDISSIYATDEASDYIFFTVDGDKDYDYDLYVYDIKEQMKTLVASEVRGVKTGADGESVFYVTDCAYDGDNYEYYGTLYMYNAKDAESVRVDNGVITGSLTSNLWTGDIDPESFHYNKYSNKSEKGYQYYVYYYDGEPVKVGNIREED